LEVLVLIKSLVLILIVGSSFVLVAAQAPDVRKEDTDKAAKTASGMRGEKLVDLPFPGGLDLQFIIKELARDIDLNVLFDPDTFRSPGRKTTIELKNVTPRSALEYIFLQERLVFEEVGPKTILVSNQYRGTSIPQIGVGVVPLTDQLAGYFGVEGGTLINYVRPDSPAAKAGLKAGDVIVEIGGVAVRGALGAIRVIDDKNESDVTLKFVRDRKGKTLNLTAQKGIK
jgi:membrane-associated protease RseP (regulator of RpoE activity)